MSDSVGGQEAESQENQHGAIGAAESSELLARHLLGDTRAFPELLKRYRARVFSYIVRCGVNEGSRDDLFQEIFIKVHRSADKYNMEKPLDPWLFTIVANCVRSHFKKKGYKKNITENASDIDSDSSLAPVYNITGEDHLQAKQTKDLINSSIQELPLNQREVLVMCCFKDMTQEEVGQSLGIPVNTVKTNLRRARASLAKALAKQRKQQISEEAS